MDKKVALRILGIRNHILEVRGRLLLSQTQADINNCSQSLYEIADELERNIPSHFSFNMTHDNDVDDEFNSSLPPTHILH